MRMLSLVVALLPMLACSNVNERGWSGGGTHFSTGTMYTGPRDTSATDTADTAADTGPVDTGSVEGTGLTPTSASCDVEDMPNLGLAVTCTSDWSAADALILDGGSVDYNLMDADSVSLTNGNLTISTDVTTPDSAYLEDSTITFSLAPIDEGVGYIVWFYATSKDGTQNSEETPYVVSP